MGETLIVLRQLVKSYGAITALDGVTLEIERGEFLALLGPSGCGKTTLLRLIAGFIEPTSGAVEIAGRVVNDVPPHERPVNTVFQNYALFPHLTAAENIAFGLKRKKVPRRDIPGKVDAVLDMVGMREFGERFPRALSGGQQQRVALARAIVNEPRVLLLDEPLGALDLKLRKHMQMELKRLHEKLGMTFIYVTHDQEEALVMADRIAVMDRGRIVQLGTGEEIYRSPNSRYVADFIGEANLIDCVVDREGRLRLSAHSPPLPYTAEAADGQATVMIRPESIEIVAADSVEHPPPGTVRLTGRINDKIFVGASLRLYVTLETGQEIAVQPGFREASEDAAPGREVVLAWPQDRARILLQ
jgi:spermidine/putrescine transport system ATP-binding protein